MLLILFIASRPFGFCTKGKSWKVHVRREENISKSHRDIQKDFDWLFAIVLRATKNFFTAKNKYRQCSVLPAILRITKLRNAIIMGRFVLRVLPRP